MHGVELETSIETEPENNQGKVVEDVLPKQDKKTQYSKMSEEKRRNKIKCVTEARRKRKADERSAVNSKETLRKSKYANMTEQQRRYKIQKVKECREKRRSIGGVNDESQVGGVNDGDNHQNGMRPSAQLIQDNVPATHQRSESHVAEAVLQREDKKTQYSKMSVEKRRNKIKGVTEVRRRRKAEETNVVNSNETVKTSKYANMTEQQRRHKIQKVKESRNKRRITEAINDDTRNVMTNQKDSASNTTHVKGERKRSGQTSFLKAQMTLINCKVDNGCQ